MQRMKISVISFTERGRKLADKIRDCMPDMETEVFFKPSEGVTAWAGEQFAQKRALIFVGACGIAVRAVSPFVRDKLADSPVLVADEKGRYVIPILSGHVGGANELAVILAEKLGAEAVITTATDLNNVFAADMFAKENGLQIMNRDGIAKVSSKALRGERITVAVEDNQKKLLQRMPDGVDLVLYPPVGEVDILVSTRAPAQGMGISDGKGLSAESVGLPVPEEGKCAGKMTLWLKPKEYYIGIGCKKGKAKEEIDAFIRENLNRLGIAVSDIAGIASIERKKEETGICEWALQNRVPFFTYTEEELNAVEGVFHGSDFVRETVGVDNVCERAARKAGGEESILVLEKQAEDGMTIAIAKCGKQSSK